MSWYFSKKTTTDSPRINSFREFLGIKNGNLPSGTNDNDFSTDFDGQNPMELQNYDTNSNGIYDWLEDLNGNGIIDGDEDLNGNGIPDRLEDANNNSIPDPWENTGSLDPDNGVDDNDNWGDDGGFGNDGGFNNGTINPETGTGTTTPIDNNPVFFPEEGDSLGFEISDFDNFNWGDSFSNFEFGEVDISSCRIDDINIQFTAEELVVLQALEERYMQISSELYSQETVTEQKNLYSQLKLRHARIAELVNFCEVNAPKIANADMQKRVPTPFWNDPSKDSDSFTNYQISTSEDNNYGTKPVQSDYRNFATLFERIFRINIW